MRLHGENAPQGLVADDLFSRRVEVSTCPEVPGVAPLRLLGSKSGIARLVATGFSAGALVVALLGAGRERNAEREYSDALNKDQEENALAARRQECSQGTCHRVRTRNHLSAAEASSIRDTLR